MRALFPASFDPVTNGHMDILNRVSVVFDSVVAGVVDNARAGNLFATQERVDLLEEAPDDRLANGAQGSCKAKGKSLGEAQEPCTHLHLQWLRTS